MQYINKSGKIPVDVDAFFKTNKNRWVAMPESVRKNLINELMDEQKGLCCYCCMTLKDSNVKVEHLASRDNHPKKIHNYNNLLLSCTETKQCDNAKSNKDIPMTPLEKRCDTAIKMRPNGELYGKGADQKDANDSIDILKLNNKGSENRRSSIIREIEDYLKVFNICDNVYQLKDYKNKQALLNYLQDFPMFEEIRYIISKLV